MSKAFKARSSTAFHMKRTHIVALDGSTHHFTVGDKKARKAAIEAAQAAGDAHLATMRQQKGGAELSKQERLTGQHDAPAAEETGPRSLRPDPGEKRNPYRVAADSEASRAAHSRDELGRRATRVAHFNRLADEYDAQEAAKEVVSAHWASEETQAMVADANNMLTSITADPQSTPGKIAMARHVHQLATTTVLDPAMYRKMVADASLATVPPTPNKKAAVSMPLTDMIADGLAVQPQAGDA